MESDFRENIFVRSTVVRVVGTKTDFANNTVQICLTDRFGIAYFLIRNNRPYEWILERSVRCRAMIRFPGHLRAKSV